MDIESSRNPSPGSRNYEEDLKGLFTFELTQGMTRSPGKSTENKGVQGEEVLALKQKLISQEMAFESEKFKLVQNFTMKLREEERHRIDLLSKVAELEGTKLRLEKELFEGASCRFENSLGMSMEGMKSQIDQLLSENRGLKLDLQHRIHAMSNVHESESRLETDQLRNQLRIMESELRSKEEEVDRLHQTIAGQKQENRRLEDDFSRIEGQLGSVRQDCIKTERENASFKQELQRLNAENNRLVLKLQEYANLSTDVRLSDYATLQQRLEDTTLRIRSLEEQIFQTSANFEELRSQVPVSAQQSITLGKRGKSRNSGRKNTDSGKVRKRSKSKEGRNPVNVPQVLRVKKTRKRPESQLS